MYKNRFYFWGIILLMYLGINIFSNLNISSLIATQKEIMVDIQADTSIKTVFTNTKIRNIKLIQNTNNPVIIIKNHSEENINGFEKIENAIYSPIVAFIPSDETMPSNLYYSLGNDSKFINFKAIANAIINDKTLKEMGIGDSDEKIILNIPSRGTFYYDKVVETIYISLNDNVVPTQKEREELEETVQKLLDKSVECNDVNQKIDSGDKSYNIFLAPEFYLNESSNYSTTSNAGYYRAMYFEKSTCLAYDIFIKENECVNEIPLKELIEENILKEEKFPNSCYFRTSGNSDYQHIFGKSFVTNQLDIVY